MSVEASATVGPPPGMRVRLSSNESAFGPSPDAARAAVTAIGQAHLYPDDQAVALRAAIAAHDGVSLDQVAVGTGSAALLMDVVAHEAGGGAGAVPGSVVAFERSFVVYRLAARNAGLEYVEAPTGGPATDPGGGYARDPQALLDLVDDRTRVVLIDNPGNPTGTHLAGDDLATLVRALPAHVTVVIDEAYHHFAAGHGGYRTIAELDVEHPRLLVTRTFSKAYGLAGLRVGQLLGPVGLVRSVDAWRTRFNVTAPGQAAAMAALGDTDHLAATVRGTIAGRTRMQDWFAGHGIPHTPSLGNFVTIETSGPAADVVGAFAAAGIGVRPLLPYGMDRQVRVSVGVPAEVDAFLEVAGDVLVP